MIIQKGEKTLTVERSIPYFILALDPTEVEDFNLLLKFYQESRPTVRNSLADSKTLQKGLQDYFGDFKTQLEKIIEERGVRVLDSEEE